MRLVLPMLLAAAVVGCSDAATAPRITTAGPSAYKTVGGPSTGNPPPPPLVAGAVFELSGSVGLSAELPATFDLNATRDGATIQILVGGAIGGFAAGPSASDVIAYPAIFYTPGPNGGAVAGVSTITLLLRNDVVTIDLSRNVRGNTSILSPSCTAGTGNDCAIIRIEGAMMYGLLGGRLHPVNGLLHIMKEVQPPPPPPPPIG